MARPTSDEAVERLLKRSLSAHSAAGDEVCPEPDLLAAFADGGLSRNDALQIERHASSCARCTQVLALVLRAEPVPSVEPVGGILAAWRAWRWAIPVATLTTVAGLWFVSTRPPTVHENPSSSPEIAQVAEPPQQAPTEQSKTVSQPQASVAAPVPRDSRTRTTDELRKSQSGELKERLEAKQERAKSDVRVQPESTVAEKREADAFSRETADRRQSPAAAAEASALTARSDVAATPPAAGAGGAPSGRAATPAAPSVPSQRDAQSRLELRSAQANDAAASLSVRSRDSSVWWRAVGAVIQRSTDAGGSWSEEYRANRPFRGGVAAASGDVVWFFGRTGLLLRRTTDGWSPVQAPADVDIVSIEAPNATTAMITLSDGRRFQTNNGGAAWAPR